MNICSECGGVGGCKVGCAGPPDLRVKPPYGTNDYIDWKLDEVAAIGYVIGRTYPHNAAGSIDANAFGQYFAERCNSWRDLDSLYDKFTKEVAA